MKIVLLLKQVPESGAVKMDEATGTVLRQSSEAVINPLDLYAVEAALRLRDKIGGECLAITMGQPSAVSVLREAISLGIDRGALITDRAFAGSDTWATGRILSAAIRKLCPDFDLIVCGERATDGDTGQVGPETAAALNLPVVTYVNRIDGVTSYNRHQPIARKVLSLVRIADTDQENITVELPALITVVKEIASPRLPTLSGKINARLCNIPVLTNGELQLSETEIGLSGSPTRVVRIFHPRLTRNCVMVNASDAEAATHAASQLRDFLEKKND